MIYVALLFFIGFFAADVLQYFFGALLHRNLAQKHERNQLESKGKIDRNAEIIKPRWLDWPALCFFLAKGIFLTLGFLSIGVQLLLKLVN
jgi:membrane protein DedA with SNARE-associated domain